MKVLKSLVAAKRESTIAGLVASELENTAPERNDV